VVALLALLLQVIAIKAPLGDSDDLRRALFVYSYLLLLVFVAANFARPGIAIIGFGLLLNFIAIVANQGWMAITPETLLQSGPMPGDAVLGEWVPGTKDILLHRSDVHLWALTDRLVWDPISSVIRAFSIGDVVIVGGVLITLVELFLPRIKEEPLQPPNGAPAQP
jgi:hypothetical protein